MRPITIVMISLQLLSVQDRLMIQRVPFLYHHRKLEPSLKSRVHNLEILQINFQKFCEIILIRLKHLTQHRTEKQVQTQNAESCKLNQVKTAAAISATNPNIELLVLTFPPLNGTVPIVFDVTVPAGPIGDTLLPVGTGGFNGAV